MFRPVRRVRPLVAAVAVAGILISACGTAPSRVAAVVNGDEIAESVLERIVSVERQALAERGVTGVEALAQLREVQRQQLTNVIRIRIAEAEAVRRGLVVTDERIDEIWDEQIAILGGLEELQATLAELSLTEQEARDQLRAQEIARLLQESVREEIVVTDEDVEVLYLSLGDQWVTRGASHIMVATQDEIDEIASLLAADPDSFGAVAMERSIDTASGALGGVLPNQPRAIGYPPSFEEALWNNDVGSIVGPIETDFGFHMVRVDNEEVTTFEQARGQLTEQIRGQQFAERYANFETDLWRSADIKLNGRYGSWDEVVGEVVLLDPLDQ